MIILNIFIIIICVLLVLVVLSQNSKGGGLSGQFGGSAATSQILGARRTGDFLSKATWVLIVLLFMGSFFSTKIAKSGRTTSNESAADEIELPTENPDLEINDENSNESEESGINSDAIEGIDDQQNTDESSNTSEKPENNDSDDTTPDETE